MSSSKITLSDTQKYEFCLFANNKLTRKEYVAWIEQKWGGLQFMNQQ